MNYVLYNALSNNKRGEAAADALIAKLGGGEKQPVHGIDFCEYLSKLTAEDRVYLCGGDGALNYFVNAIYGKEFAPEIYFYPAGSGNDFYNDIKTSDEIEAVELTQYLKNLPTVYVSCMEKKFLNGIGFGLDGVCCEIGDQKRAKSDKPINYTSIAIKLLLFSYKPRNATVIVDGKEYKFEKVWIAPTMKGRFFGGGIKVAPRQDRLNEDNTVTCVVANCKGRLNIFTKFPKITAGKHESFKGVYFFKGKEVTVKFDSPCALQIDGETVLNVTEYTVKA